MKSALDDLDVDCRLALPADAAAIVSLDAQVSYRPFTVLQAERACDPDDRASFAYVLTCKHAVVGFIALNVVLDEATVLALAVRPLDQRRGLGKRLLQYALAALEANGVPRCLLEVRADNAPALALYSGCGFGVDGRRKNYYATPEGRKDAILMSRQAQMG